MQIENDQSDRRRLVRGRHNPACGALSEQIHQRTGREMLPSVNGRDVCLRAIREDDLVFLQQLITDPADQGSFMWQGFRDSREWHQRWQATSSFIRDTGGELMVIAKDDPAGIISWSEHHWFGRACWSLGIHLSRPMRNQGIGSRAHELIVSYLFSQTLPDRIEAYTETENIAECRALERSGFVREGTLRHVSSRNGQWRDGVLYSILRND